MKIKVILLCGLIGVGTLFAEEDDFDKLMGKQTQHWEHAHDPLSAGMLEQFRSLYNKNKNLRFITAPETKIPKIVHFIWLGPRQFPPESVENVRNWIAKNPDWKLKFWTDRDRPAPCNGMETIILRDYPFPHLGKCYEASDNWGEKSDILRYEILYQEGGVYVDHDANCLQPFHGLHAGYDLYCCLEAPHPPVAGFNITLGIGVIGSRPGHPVIKQVIDRIASSWDELAQKYPGNDGFSRTQIVMERTYLALTQVIREGIDQNGNVDIVLPAAYFFAKPGIAPLYSKHFFGNSWAEGGEKSSAFERVARRELGKIDQKISNLIFFSSVVLSFNLILMGFLVLFLKKWRRS